MALVSNAMTMFGVSIYWEGVITGSILTAAVSIDMLSRRRLKKNRKTVVFRGESSWRGRPPVSVSPAG
jgi:hypothetical protein